MRVERARYFLAAVQTGSLRAAAAACGVSQPALGQQVAMLEEELNLVLLTRSRHGARPTDAGQAMIEPLTRLVTAEDLALDAAADASGTHTGRVSIGAISMAVEALIAPVIARLREEHSRLRFIVTEGPSSDVESSVLDGRLDFGVITRPTMPPASGLRRTTLLRAPLGALVPHGHLLARRRSLRWADLTTWPVVTMREGTVLWDRLERGNRDVEVVVQSASARSLQIMVRNGAGIGILTPMEAIDRVPGLAWIPLGDAEPIDLGLVQRADTRPSPSALVVRRLIESRASTLLDAATDPSGVGTATWLPPESDTS